MPGVSAEDNGVEQCADGLGVFRFYLDESERGGALAVGGYVARVKQWDRFEAEWDARLREARVKVFHATDFYNHYGEFEVRPHLSRSVGGSSRTLCSAA